MFQDHSDDLFDIARNISNENWPGSFLSGGTARERMRSNDTWGRSKPHTQIKRVMKWKTAAANNAVNIKQAVVTSSVPTTATKADIDIEEGADYDEWTVAV